MIIFYIFILLLNYFYMSIFYHLFLVQNIYCFNNNNLCQFFVSNKNLSYSISRIIYLILYKHFFIVRSGDL